MPSAAETARNPRAASARLRAAERLLRAGGLMASTARAVSSSRPGLPRSEPASSRPAAGRGPSQSRCRRSPAHGVAIEPPPGRACYGVSASCSSSAHWPLPLPPHTFVASDQQRIDTLQSQLTQTLAEQQDLQLSRAELESPAASAGHRRAAARDDLTAVGLLSGAGGPGAVGVAGWSRSGQGCTERGRDRPETCPAGGDRTRTGTSLAGARSLTIPPPVR